MANRERGEMGLVCEGQSYTLRLTVEACCEAQDRTGLTFDDLCQQVNRGRVKELRWLLWAALQDRHASAFVTPDAAGSLMDALGGVLKTKRVLVALMALNADERPAPPATKPARTTKPVGSTWHRLYIDARALGLGGDLFWRLSLKELWLEMSAARERQLREQEHTIRLAWWCSAMVWAKSLPDLDTLLSRVRAPRMQTREGMAVALHALSAQYGLPLRIKKAPAHS